MSKEDLQKDPNYIAYKAMEAELKEKHMGKCVAFSNGELVLIEDDRATLFKKADQEGITGFFYKEIVEVERVYHMPTRFFRKRD